jgi:hypothetical protein
MVLDPLLTMVNTKLDTHKDAEVRRALEPIVRLAQETGASLIGLIHVNKANEGDLSNRVMGSKALVAVPRAVLFCAKYQRIEENTDWGEDEGMPQFASPSGHHEFIFGQVKNNLAATITSSVKYHMETEIVGHDDKRNKDIRTSRLVTGEVLGRSIEDIVMEQEKRRAATKTQGGRGAAWLVGYLRGKGEVTRDAVFAAAKDAGISKKAVYAGKDELGDRLIVRRLPVVPSRTTWELREEGEAGGATAKDASPEPLPHKTADGRFIAYLSDGGNQTHYECATCGTHYNAGDGKTYYTTDGNGKYATHCPGCVRGEGGPKHPDVVWSWSISEEEWDLLGRRG